MKTAPGFCEYREAAAVLHSPNLATRWDLEVLDVGAGTAPCKPVVQSLGYAYKAQAGNAASRC